MRTVGQAGDDGSQKIHVDETANTPPLTPDGKFDWLRLAEEKRLKADREPFPDFRHPEDRAKGINPQLEALGEVVKIEELKTEQEKEKTKREELRQGKQALPQPADPNCIKLKVVRSSDVTDKNEKPYFLLEPYLIADSVVGFYGRGSSGKSSLLATMAAEISSHASTLWISTEETETNVLNRYMKGIRLKDGSYTSWGHDATLQVFQTVVTKKDKDGRAIESMFNVYEHLEPAIIMANTNVMNESHQKPVKLVVLDTIVALTTWDRQAGPNSDEGVKRLMTFLRGVAERQRVTIAVVGHSNKGKHDHFADSVMGATAWTTSPRLSFLHAKDRTTDGQIIVRLAKSNEVQDFAQLFSLHMVHELAQIADGPKAGMFKVCPGERVWGGQHAEDLWDEVTTPPKDEDESGFVDRRKPTVVDNVLMAVVELVHASGEPVTRDMIHARLGRDVSRREWKKVDDRLSLAPFQYKVKIVAGPQNKAVYQTET